MVRPPVIRIVLEEALCFSREKSFPGASVPGVLIFISRGGSRDRLLCEGAREVLLLD